MAYIIANWGHLNLVDRAWFIAGAWLLILFLTVFSFRIWRAIFKSKETDRHLNS